MHKQDGNHCCSLATFLATSRLSRSSQWTVKSGESRMEIRLVRFVWSSKWSLVKKTEEAK